MVGRFSKNFSNLGLVDWIKLDEYIVVSGREKERKNEILKCLGTGKWFLGKLSFVFKFKFVY